MDFARKADKLERGEPQEGQHQGNTTRTNPGRTPIRNAEAPETKAQIPKTDNLYINIHAGVYIYVITYAEE